MADRSLIVTGAGSGIGAHVASLAAQRGARVVAMDRDRDALEGAVERLADASVTVVGHVGDVASAADCRAVVARAEEVHGRLDGLVNNAAIGAFGLTLESTTEAEWDRVLSINLKSVYLMSRAALPALRRARGAAIVNVSSVHALATAGGVLPYAAAKGGVLAMTRAMAIDLAADAIRVVAVLPGATDTPMLAEQAEREGKDLDELGFSRRPEDLGRIITPQEVAEAILFAASESASALSGSAIIADAGLMARL